MAVLSSLLGIGQQQPVAGPAVATTAFPAELAPYYKDILSKAQALYEDRTAEGYQPYQGPTIAEFTPEQQQAFAGIAGLAGQQAPKFAEAERAFRNKGLNINDYLSPTQKAEGGLINLAAGGEFSGMVPGRGGGMDDNVFMPIKEGNKQVGTLAVSPTEYVVDSYTMAALGDGNPSEGAKVMDGVVKRVRQKAYGTMKQPNEIDGLQALRPMMEGV